MSIDGNKRDFEVALIKAEEALQSVSKEYSYLKGDIEEIMKENNELIDENEALQERIADMEEEIYDLKVQLDQAGFDSD